MATCHPSSLPYEMGTSTGSADRPVTRPSLFYAMRMVTESNARPATCLSSYVMGSPAPPIHPVNLAMGSHALTLSGIHDETWTGSKAQPILNCQTVTVSRQRGAELNPCLGWVLFRPPTRKAQGWRLVKCLVVTSHISMVQSAQNLQQTSCEQPKALPNLHCWHLGRLSETRLKCELSGKDTNCSLWYSRFLVMSNPKQDLVPTGKDLLHNATDIETLPELSSWEISHRIKQYPLEKYPLHVVTCKAGGKKTLCHEAIHKNEDLAAERETPWAQAWLHTWPSGRCSVPQDEIFA